VILDTRLSISAFKMALRGCSIKPGLIHHSDRRVQYASGKYIELLKHHEIIVSMSRKGNPYDNAIIESFIKTLNHEEVLLNEYESFERRTIILLTISMRFTIRDDYTLH